MTKTPKKGLDAYASASK